MCAAGVLDRLCARRQVSVLPGIAKDRKACGLEEFLMVDMSAQNKHQKDNREGSYVTVIFGGWVRILCFLWLQRQMRFQTLLQGQESFFATLSATKETLCVKIITFS